MSGGKRSGSEIAKAADPDDIVAEVLALPADVDFLLSQFERHGVSTLSAALILAMALHRLMGRDDAHEMLDDVHRLATGSLKNLEEALFAEVRSGTPAKH